MSELMAARGHSFRSLGRAVTANPGYLNKLATGSRGAPGPTLAAAIDRELGADGELAALARQEHAPPAVPGQRPMGDTEAANIRATVQHLVALDTLQGSGGLTPIATRAFRAAADRLAVVGGSADVRSAAADLGAAAAWIASDDVQRDHSRNIALEALALADLAGDTRLHRFLLSHLSMVAEHGGRYADALAFAERLLAENHDNPRVEAMVEIRRARALSGLGAHTDALEAWDRAEHLLTASPSADDGLTYWIHSSEMAIHKAVVLTRAHDRHAVDWAHRGVEWLPAGQGRDQVLFRAMLLSDAVEAHAWSEVPRIVEDLLQFAGAAGTARVPELLDRIWNDVARGRVPAAAKDAVYAACTAFNGTPTG
ncbi:hypothetical protein [Actinoplanes regularis]|uniref:hypothetical protein n=1 Tax=Actinoplanes regularis TaxID=52697 RepID=UPI00255451CC|nr:hypothetical protein [Actinoplanes regularis]